MKIKIVKRPDRHDKKYYVVLVIISMIGLGFINYFNYYNIIGLLIYIVLMEGYTAIWDWVHDDEDENKNEQV